MRKIGMLVVAVGVLLGAAAPIAYAQKGVGDPTGVARQPVRPAIVSLSGKIVEVQTGPCQATTGRSVSGTHIILETAQEEELNIHLGPAWAVADTVAKLSVGQQIAVSAFRTEKMEEHHYVAQSLSFDETTVELRDEGLRPVWAGGSAPRRGPAAGQAVPGSGRGQAWGRGPAWEPAPGGGRGAGGRRGAGWGRGPGRTPGPGWGRGGQRPVTPPQREPVVSEEPAGKIAVTAVEPSMDADVEPQFGRSPYFLLIDPEEDTFEALKNPDTARGGASARATELIAAKGAKVLLTGKCGPKAIDALAAAGIEVVTGCSGTVRTVVEQFKAGQLQAADKSETPPESASDRAIR